jgi:hypothetical protein
MARHRDLPGWLAAVHPRYLVPHHAEITLGALICVLAATVDLRGVIGFSSPCRGSLTSPASPYSSSGWPDARSPAACVGRPETRRADGLGEPTARPTTLAYRRDVVDDVEIGQFLQERHTNAVAAHGL